MERASRGSLNFSLCKYNYSLAVFAGEEPSQSSHKFVLASEGENHLKRRSFSPPNPLTPFSYTHLDVYKRQVKPCSCGSSVGVSMADTRDELVAALAFASLYADSVLVEEKIVGREFSISVLGDRTLPAVEIIPKSGFYDYKNKYQSEDVYKRQLSSVWLFIWIKKWDTEDFRLQRTAA